MPNALLRLHLMTVKLLELENKPAEVVHNGPQKEEMGLFLIIGKSKLSNKVRTGHFVF